MRNYILLSAIVLILSTIPSFTNAQTCGEHPVLPLLEKFITAHNKYVNNATRPNKKDDDEPFNDDSILEAYKQSQGQAVNDLSFCQDYNSGEDPTKLSCCTNDLVQMFPKLTKGFFRRRIANPPEPTKLLKTLKFLGGKCGAQDADSLDAKEEVKIILENFKECQKNSTAAEVNLLRGTLCSLCVPPSGFTQYFEADTNNVDDIKIFVTKNTIDQYDEDIQDGLTCFDQAQDQFASLIEDMLATWDNTDCQEEIEIIDEILDDPQRKHGNNKGCKEKAKPMSDVGCLKETEEDGEFNYPQYEKYSKRSEDDGPLQQQVGIGYIIEDDQEIEQEEEEENRPGQQFDNIVDQYQDDMPDQGQGQIGEQQGQGYGQGGYRPYHGGNRRRQLLELRILSGTGGYVESANGLDNIYSKDPKETQALISEKAVDGVVEAAAIQNDTTVQPRHTTPKINHSQVLQLGTVLLLALVSILLL